MGAFSRGEDVPEPGASEAASPDAGGGTAGETFLPPRGGRRRIESALVRAIATGGIIGIGTAIAAVMGTQDVNYWIVGLVVSGVTLLLAAVLWSSRTL